MGVEIPAGQLGGDSFGETCRQICIPGLRAAGAMEYDALSCRFNCPFVNPVFLLAAPLRNVKKGDEPVIREYPLIGKGVTVPLEDLAKRI